jgi:hypothetical protein
MHSRCGLLFYPSGVLLRENPEPILQEPVLFSIFTRVKTNF